MMGESRAIHHELARRWLVLAVVVLTVVMAGCAPGRAGAAAPSFTLVNQHGEMTRLDDLRGRTVLLTFLYTNCPDTCPLYLANVAATLHGIREEDGERPTVVVVTVDPDRDTVERLRTFAATWPPDWQFLTGTYQQVSAVWQSYGVVAEKQPLAGSSDVHAHHGYAVVHTARLWVIDPLGQPQTELTGAWTVQDLRATLAAAPAPMRGSAISGLFAAAGELVRRCGDLAAREPGVFFSLLALLAAGGLILPTFLLRTFLSTRAPVTGTLVPDNSGRSGHDPAR